MFFDFLNKINSDLSIHYIFLRTVIIYIYAIFLIRLGNKRFHFETAFDFILIIITAAVLSRAINGSSSLIAALIGSTTLIVLHWLFAKFSFYSHIFGKLIKGKSYILIQDGKLHWENLKRNQITQEDLLELCREKLHHANFEKIKEARLERSGKISFIPRTTLLDK